MYSLKSLQTYQLNKKVIQQILKIKDQTWKFGINSQTEYFNSNVKKNDIHNFVFLKSSLVGYTFLSKKNLFIRNKKIRILYLDSMVVNSNFRGKKIASLLMNFNNHIIFDYDYFCVLSCDKKMVKFYKKFLWSKMSQNIKISRDIKPNLIKMCFNKKKLIKHENKKK
tara:strand:+ start:328 stop:828 length:501 start_codon:yes stop_codon:yes gene_type:complete